MLACRFTDFKVNEIDIDGNVVHLTSFVLPPSFSEAPTDNNTSDNLDSPAAVSAAYESLIGTKAAAKTQELIQFLEQAKSHKDDSTHPSPPSLILDAIPDKNLRRSIHQLFKNLTWAPPLVSDAVALEGSTDLHGIRIGVNTAKGRQAENQTGQKRKWQQREQWPGGKAHYLRFALYKENFDVQHALTTMAQTLHLSPKLFGVAGTKDKRGVTVQWATAHKVVPSKLARVNTAMRNIRVGNFSYVNDRLQLGDLRGNKFEIVLRALSVKNPKAVEEAAAALKSAGFINYYGLQRFGSSQVPTHLVGRALLRGEWEEAIQLIMAPAESTKKEISLAISDFLAGGSPEEALKVFPWNLVAERSILSVMAKQGRTAVVNALSAIPRNLRSMYMHAYQSYAWNEAASERVLRHGGDRVIAGDLVISRSLLQAARQAKVGNQHQQPQEEHQKKAKEGGRGDIAEGVIGDVVVDGLEVESDGLDEDLTLEPHVVTAEEAASGMYCIEDLVLPVPGYKVKFPENDIGDVYQDLLKKDGISMESSPHKVKEFSIRSMPGAYRHVLCRPDDLEYTVLSYGNKDTDLSRTDLDEIKGTAPLELPTEGGKYLALRLAFSLPSSTYATMLIRELTKMPTNIDFFKGLQHPE